MFIPSKKIIEYLKEIRHYTRYFTANTKIKLYTGNSIEKSISLNRCAFVEHPVLYFYNRKKKSDNFLQFNKKSALYL